MKSYPTIPAKIQPNLPIYAFDKIDGSNIRAEWVYKKGFVKFGSRTRLLGEDQPIIYKAKDLILEQLDIVSDICKSNRWAKATLFYEFYGPNSFAGHHCESDEHKVILIDVCVHKKGFLSPREFINTFQNLPSAQLLYHGNCTVNFIQSVSNGNLDGITSEGVVCKFKGKGNSIGRFKIKTYAWYDRLREFCNGDAQKFDLLK